MALWNKESAWIPLCIVSVISLFFLNMIYTVTGQYALQNFCLELDLPASCNDDLALRNSSRFSLINLLVSGVLLLGTVGIFGAISNRLGRIWTFLLAGSGQLCIAIVWLIIFYFPEQIGSSWKILVLGSTVVASLGGGVLIYFLSIFGMVGDLSANNPKLRTTLYVVFDIIYGLAGVGGAQAAAALMKYDGRYLTSIASGGVVIAFLFAYFALPETIPLETRLQPIDKKKANVIGQMAFLFPLSSTKDLQETDRKRIYDRVSELYQKQQLEGEILSPYHSPEIPTSLESSANESAAVSTYISDDSINQTSLNTITRSSSSEDTSTNKLTTTIPELRLSQPPRCIPHKYSMLTLTICLFLNVLILLGHKVIDLFFLKKKFSISVQDYSNLSTISSVSRGVGSFICFPIFKKLFHTPMLEVYLLVGSCVVQGLAFFAMPFATSFTQFCIMSIIGFLAATFPGGIVRSLASNQFTQGLQRHILSAIAAAEVWVWVFGGVGFNLVWINTGDTAPGTIYIIFGALAMVAAVIPLLNPESAADFNLRIEMTIQYTKIESAEMKIKDQIQENKLGSSRSLRAKQSNNSSHFPLLSDTSTKYNEIVDDHTYFAVDELYSEPV